MVGGGCWGAGVGGPGGEGGGGELGSGLAAKRRRGVDGHREELDANHVHGGMEEAVDQNLGYITCETGDLDLDFNIS